MKKLKKVWMLALLAAGFAMVIGCSNGSSDSASGDDGSGGGNGGGQTSGTEKPDDPAGGDDSTTEDVLTLVIESGTVVPETETVGHLDFNKFTNYPDNFDAAVYKKVTVKLQLTKDGKPYTETLDGKLTVNDSTLGWGGNIFNGGYGDGFVVKYLDNFTTDSDGYVTIEFDFSNVGDISTANCFSAQLGEVKFTLTILEAKFEK